MLGYPPETLNEEAVAWMAALSSISDAGYHDDAHVESQ